MRPLHHQAFISIYFSFPCSLGKIVPNDRLMTPRLLSPPEILDPPLMHGNNLNRLNHHQECIPVPCISVRCGGCVGGVCLEGSLPGGSAYLEDVCQVGGIYLGVYTTLHLDPQVDTHPSIRTVLETGVKHYLSATTVADGNNIGVKRKSVNMFFNKKKIYLKMKRGGVSVTCSRRYIV